ncbi:uncharacterized protein LOC135374580 [Ornithodoros turicata]|uniref:uncharacterized protein LOC135374580 n=1 Tax=Ornithodoros turicata TaxID=34597 RepID=UPI003139E65E
MDVVSLVAAGRELGLEGAELREWIQAQEAKLQATEREKRAADREAAKEAAATAKEAAELRLRELEATNEARKAEADLIERKLRLLELEGARPAPAVSQTNHVPMLGLQKGMALFDERKDDLHAYLLRFERVAKSQKWPESHWAASLSMCLTGEALGVYSRVAPEHCGDYEKVKAALFKRFRLTAEGFRERFRIAAGDYKELRELVIREQFVLDCSNAVALFLKEKKLKSLEEIAEAADDYMEAHGIRNWSSKQGETQKAVKGGTGITKGQDPAKLGPGDQKDKSSQGRPPQDEKSPPRCYLCGKMGHIANQCRSIWHKRNDSIRCNNCGKVGHRAEACRGKLEGQADKTSQAQSSCFVATGPRSLRSNIEDGYVELKSGDRVPVVNAVLSSKIKVLARDLPVVEGRIGQTKVTVLRDTGSNTVVVRRELVQDSQLTGQVGLVYLVDGTMRRLPEAVVSIRTPYFSGDVTTKVMDTLLYDVILGNNPGVRAADDPDEDWDRREKILSGASASTEEDFDGRDCSLFGTQGSHDGVETGAAVADVSEITGNTTMAVVTRSQSKAAERPLPKLRVTQIDGGPADVASLIKAQEEDATLRTCHRKTGQVQQCHNTNKTFEFIKEEGVLYRRYHIDEGRTLQQLVAPRVQADVQRFVRSCDSCQKTTPKGRIARAPLQSMPKIDTPFERVAVDIVGPISPPSRSGNRYILTLVDFATRYPDAIPLRSIETERVAEGLVEILSRVGIPKEILSDRGSNFVSGLMREVGRLLSIRQMQTTPYHPMGNGLVEHFNGTLKSMLRRMCEEGPTDWDRYLPELLFAYREVPQKSLVFSPFDMLYRRLVRGPLTVLKEMWTKMDIPEETRTTYEYVVNLRNRLEHTCKLAHDTLEKSGARYRRFYNAKSRELKLAAGDEVLVLLPTDNNKLLVV